MKADIKALKKELEDKMIVSVELPTDADEGLIVTLNDGTEIAFRWSGCEGGARLNGKEIDLQTY